MKKISLQKPKKAKKKVQKYTGKGLKIVDEDSFEFRNVSDSDNEEVEDLPQIAAVVDERPVEVQFLESVNQGKWKRLDDQDKSNERDDDESDGDIPGLALLKRRMRQGSPDISPPRKRTGSPDLSPPRRRKDSSDESPPRRRENLSGSRNRKFSPDSSTTRRPRCSSNSSPSPPRKRRSSRDLSPQRRRRDSPEPSRRRKSPDSSPPRKRRNSRDSSPPRKRPYSPDNSPPRKRRNSPDSSIPRRRRTPPSTQQSSRYTQERLPGGRRRKNSSDESPVRRTRRSSDGSPPRDRSANQPYWKRRDKDRSLAKPEIIDTTDSSKQDKTLDGKRAGLQKASALKDELVEFRKRENEMFQTLSDDVSGRHAKAVKRDRRTAEDHAKEEEKLKEEAERKKQYAKWGKGLKQVEDQQDRVRSALHEMSKPLARHRDDEDLDVHLKSQDRDGDPMLEYLTAKRRKATGLPEKRRYNGPPPPPNRFQILPGYRWDGVDRSNGYEKEWFNRINAKKALEEEAYKWSVEDL